MLNEKIKDRVASMVEDEEHVNIKDTKGNIDLSAFSRILNEDSDDLLRQNSNASVCVIPAKTEGSRIKYNPLTNQIEINMSPEEIAELVIEVAIGAVDVLSEELQQIRKEFNNDRYSKIQAAIKELESKNAGDMHFEWEGYYKDVNQTIMALQNSFFDQVKEFYNVDDECKNHKIKVVFKSGKKLAAKEHETRNMVKWIIMGYTVLLHINNKRSKIKKNLDEIDALLQFLSKIDNRVCLLFERYRSEDEKNNSDFQWAQYIRDTENLYIEMRTRLECNTIELVRGGE